MKEGQTVRTVASGSEDIDIFYLWGDCPWVSECQEWVEACEMGFTDAHDSKTEDISFTAPSDGFIIIGIRMYNAGDWDHTSTYTMENYIRLQLLTLMLHRIRSRPQRFLQM